MPPKPTHELRKQPERAAAYRAANCQGGDPDTPAERKALWEREWRTLHSYTAAAALIDVQAASLKLWLDEQEKKYLRNHNKEIKRAARAVEAEARKEELLAERRAKNQAARVVLEKLGLVHTKTRQVARSDDSDPKSSPEQERTAEEDIEEHIANASEQDKPRYEKQLTNLKKHRATLKERGWDIVDKATLRNQVKGKYKPIPEPAAAASSAAAAAAASVVQGKSVEELQAIIDQAQQQISAGSKRAAEAQVNAPVVKRAKISAPSAVDVALTHAVDHDGLIRDTTTFRHRTKYDEQYKRITEQRAATGLLPLTFDQDKAIWLLAYAHTKPGQESGFAGSALAPSIINDARYAHFLL